MRSICKINILIQDPVCLAAQCIQKGTVLKGDKEKRSRKETSNLTVVTNSLRFSRNVMHFGRVLIFA